jgi:hypothetical protein
VAGVEPYTVKRVSAPAVKPAGDLADETTISFSA